MINKLLGFFSYDLGIDLGTSNTLVYVSGKGIMIREPSCVARNKKTGEVLAFGQTAYKMKGRVTKNIEVVYPLKDGVIADEKAALALLSSFILKVHSGLRVASRFPRAKVVIGVPASVTEVARNSLKKVVSKSGARKVYVVDEALAAIVGVSREKDRGRARGVVDIGGGTCDIAVAMKEKILIGRSVPYAGNQMDEAIVKFMRHKYSLLVGESNAEQLKIAIATTLDTSEYFHVVRGRNLETGLPKSQKVGSFEIYEILVPFYKNIAKEVKKMLGEVTPEVSGDISRYGFYLTGGGALIRGLDTFLAKEVGVPFKVTADPLTAVVRGCGKLLGVY